MNYVATLGKIAKGSAAGVVLVTALPVFGAVGAITATGIAVGSVIGATAALLDEFQSNPSVQSKMEI